MIKLFYWVSDHSLNIEMPKKKFLHSANPFLRFIASANWDALLQQQQYNTTGSVTHVPGIGNLKYHWFIFFAAVLVQVQPLRCCVKLKYSTTAIVDTNVIYCSSSVKTQPISEKYYEYVQFV